MKIFLDMDGVIVDFHLPALRMHGADLTSEYHYPDGFGWDIVGATNYIRDRDNPRDPYALRVSEKDFWKALGFQWWSSLKPYPWAGLFIQELEKHGSVRLATSAVTSECAAGKYAWVKKNLPQYLDKLHMGCCKSDFAQGGALLIDDRDKNCKDFIEEGGEAILVPRPWNKRGYHENPYEVVMDQLRRAQCI
jgi:5'(3')-deoxyribonucleotidase